jgi:hypothetical protein
MNEYSVFLVPFDEDAIYSATHVFKHLCGNEMAIAVWVYFLVLEDQEIQLVYSVSLGICFI